MIARLAVLGAVGYAASGGVGSAINAIRYLCKIASNGGARRLQPSTRLHVSA